MKVASVSMRDGHGLGKTVCQSILLIAGKGVEGDAHCGETVQHRSRVAKDPSQPNLRQVHLVALELLDELASKGFMVRHGELGENILTQGVDLSILSEGSILRLGEIVEIRITGLRNPCHQLNGHTPGLMSAVLDNDASGELIRKCGIMGVVLKGGYVSIGDDIAVTPPPAPQRLLKPV